MNWLEQFALIVVTIAAGLFGLTITFLKKKVSRLENKLQDETFHRLHKEAKDEVLSKSNAQLVDDANKRYGGGENR